MNYVFGALVGLLWGALAAFVNLKINQAALKKSTNAAMLGANTARTAVDLIALGLAGGPGSDALRQAVGRDLGIGSCNAKAFCRRLSASGITREELLAAWRRISQENR